MRVVLLRETEVHKDRYVGRREKNVCRSSDTVSFVSMIAYTNLLDVVVNDTVSVEELHAGQERVKPFPGIRFWDFD